MRGHVEMHDPSSIVSQNQEHVQDLKRDRRHGKEVDRHHSLDVVLKEGPPSLRRWLPLAYDLLAHAGLTDVDTEFEQFTVDAGCAPEGILAAHLPDQLADFFRHRWAPGLAVTNLPGPEQPEALAVPANNGFRFDDDQGRSPIAPDFAQPRPEESISGCQFRPLHRATQYAELVSECDVFQLKGSSRFEGYGHGGSQHVKHAERRTEELMEAAQAPMFSFNFDVCDTHSGA
jgi:hypothetical protein